jgi:predicted O-linked N-acetylglucosamine transferase (SPINDLY family)
LLEGPGEGTSRLREEAAKEGISPERLVFMARTGHADYLAAYRHADLFLDTEHYNAHTTASDAMWAGCPVLTRPGVTFASRVAGSLNHHAGLESLNATDDDAFVAKAIRFAQDPAFRRHILKRLELARRQSPLFDAAGFARDLLGLFDRLLAGATSGTN